MLNLTSRENWAPRRCFHTVDFVSDWAPELGGRIDIVDISWVYGFRMSPIRNSLYDQTPFSRVCSFKSHFPHAPNCWSSDLDLFGRGARQLRLWGVEHVPRSDRKPGSRLARLRAWNAPIVCARSTDRPSMTHFVGAHKLQFRNNACAGARLAARGHTHVVMLETDMVPLRPGWMNMLHNVSTKAEDFVWVCPQRHAMLLRAPGQLF